MGSFNDYLKSLRNTPEYIAAEIYDEFTESVWRIRRQKGIKQKEIAEKMGVSPSYISTVLNGRKKLLLSAVCKIAHALNCDVKIELVPKKSDVNETNFVDIRGKTVVDSSDTSKNRRAE